MDVNENTIIARLMDKGVAIPSPNSVEIDPQVDIDRISGNGVVIHAGCKILGAATLIWDNAQIGYEAPVTVDNCQIGPEVQLKGGFFQKAVFLSQSSMGSCAHVREGVILEEQASAAHTVGLKQTILFPFVTLGSLINFCDCLMTGGTSRKNHSEVGSSYIHFNYTPNQDKATASLLGDVPRGVMLNQNPIFLGGQGGLVGPCRIDFGTVIAAGAIHRKDQLKPDRMVLSRSGKGGEMPFFRGLYRGLKRIVKNNLVYIGNLMALRQWCLQVRSQFISESFPNALFEGLAHNLDRAIEERVKRFEQLCQKMGRSSEIYRQVVTENQSELLLRQKKELFRRCNELGQFLLELKAFPGDALVRERFLENVAARRIQLGADYIKVIQALDSKQTQAGAQWLQGVVDHVLNQSLALIPSLK